MISHGDGRGDRFDLFPKDENKKRKSVRASVSLLLASAQGGARITGISYRIIQRVVTDQRTVMINGYLYMLGRTELEGL